MRFISESERRQSSSIYLLQSKIHLSLIGRSTFSSGVITRKLYRQTRPLIATPSPEETLRHSARASVIKLLMAEPLEHL